jgi:hypothetical protein
MIEIDHVLLGCRNLYLTAEKLRDEAGLECYEGGYFKGIGLAQKIVPLGNFQYLEIESIIDVEEANASERVIGRHILEVTGQKPTFISSYLRTDDFDGHVRRLGLETWDPRKTSPTGEERKAVALVAPRVDETIGNALPIWFQMNDMTRHSANRSVNHRRAPNGIAWLELGGDVDRIREWIGPEVDSLPLRLTGGEPGINAVAVRMADGTEVVIRPTSERVTEAAV